LFPISSFVWIYVQPYSDWILLLAEHVPFNARLTKTKSYTFQGLGCLPFAQKMASAKKCVEWALLLMKETIFQLASIRWV
jgi:hypothetical protein